MICPTCHQEIPPSKRGRICSQCDLPVKRFHKWHLVDSRVRHRDCSDPEMAGVVRTQGELLGVSA